MTTFSLPGPPALGPAVRSPAVILLHHYSWWFTYGDGVDRGLYYRMGEAQLGVFSNYYDMPQARLKGARPPLP